MEEKKELKCLVCDKSEQEVPLIMLTYKGNELRICPQHMPVLIHNPHQLIGKVDGADEFVAG